MKWLIIMSCFLSILLLPVQGYAHMNLKSMDVKSKVAFIRGGELWIKEEAKEQQITHEKNVLNPQWSATGEYLSYSSGKNEAENWVYSFKTKKSFEVYTGSSSHLEWAPKGNILAFLIGTVLNKAEVKPDHIGSFENVSLGVGNYSWLPDGSGFLVSSLASLLPTGWTDVRLFLVPLNANLDPTKIKPFYTIHQSKDFFAVTTSPFKWSADGKWISFIAEPTASLSSDQNTLCLLSSDAKTFKPLDTMLHNTAWLQWAPSISSLAYIQGEDRIATKNKHLKVAELPSFKTTALSAKGFVDQDFTWNNDQTLTVSRAKENLGTYNAEQKDLPILYRVQLSNNQQKQITKPAAVMGDYKPQFLQSSKNLTWIRADAKHATIWIANSDGTKAKEWVHLVDRGENYYGYVAWDSVVAWYESHKFETTTIHVLSDPAYAKWGLLAMAEVKQKYQANIVDYKHLGRKQINAQIAEEDFKFWLQDTHREFGVYVKIRFETATDKVQSILIQEA